MTRTPDPKLDMPQYRADEPLPGPDKPPLVTEESSAEENRGTRAPREGSGVVTGSGAGAGGGGTKEDFDSDDASGSQTR